MPVKRPSLGAGDAATARAARRISARAAARWLSSPSVSCARSSASAAPASLAAGAVLAGGSAPAASRSATLRAVSKVVPYLVSTAPANPPDAHGAGLDPGRGRHRASLRTLRDVLDMIRAPPNNDIRRAGRSKPSGRGRRPYERARTRPAARTAGRVARSALQEDEVLGRVGQP